MRRFPLRLVEAEQDAPNYRMVTSAKKCNVCKFAVNGFCEKYDFKFKPGATCDAWQSKEPSRAALKSIVRTNKPRKGLKRLERIYRLCTSESLYRMPLQLLLKTG